MNQANCILLDLYVAMCLKGSNGLRDRREENTDETDEIWRNGRNVTPEKVQRLFSSLQQHVFH